MRDHDNRRLRRKLDKDLRASCRECSVEQQRDLSALIPKEIRGVVRTVRGLTQRQREFGQIFITTFQSLPLLG